MYLKGRKRLTFSRKLLRPAGRTPDPLRVPYRRITTFDAVKTSLQSVTWHSVHGIPGVTGTDVAPCEPERGCPCCRKSRRFSAVIAMSDEVSVTPPLASAGQLDQLCVNIVRTLSMDAVQRANSGHPGTPKVLSRYPPADVTIERIGDLIDIDLLAHFGATVARTLIA